jgi:hypothetical protein
LLARREPPFFPGTRPGSTAGGIPGAALATGWPEASSPNCQPGLHRRQRPLEPGPPRKLASNSPFFIAGAIVYEFYAWQAIWFGQGAAWSVLVPKILVDQFIYTVFWATPYYTLLTRWQALGYSGRVCGGISTSNLSPNGCCPSW